MSFVRNIAIAVLGTVATGLFLAVPAGADPGFDPCHAMFSPICRMVPIMPDLDHDIDLTQDPNAMTDGQGGQGAIAAPDTRQDGG
jgi:hypothetical protein